MKKFIALFLALVMVFALCACGEKAPAETPEAPADPETPAELTADAIADDMTSEDGKYEIAFITDVGQLKDKSFNQGTYDGVKLFAAKNDLTYKYYQPANGDAATDDDRYDAMKAACENGAKVVVAAGFMQSAALEKAAKEFTDVNFVFIDGWDMGLANLAGIAFAEEQPGYLAGYAAVMDGYTKLGFCGGGGGTNPACIRYGYGFVQGADAAAKAKGVNVEINYSWEYGASFSASPELQTMASGWYTNGTEVIFACGGSMFQSIVAAAAANDGAVIGVDVDQSFESDTVITSAMKGLSASVEWACAKAYDGTWAEIGGNGTGTSLGAADGAVGLPTATWSLEGWTVEAYEAMLAEIASGTLVIDNNSEMAAPASTDNVTVNIIGG